MSGRHLAGGHLEGGEQRRGAVALVIMAMAGQRPAVRQLQIALSPLQRLDRGLFVDAEDNRVLRRGHVEPDHIGGLGGELRIVALAPGFAPGEVDLLGAQKAPDILHIDVAERCGQQRSRPAGIALGCGWSNSARMRLPVSAVYFGSAPRSPVSSRPPNRFSA